jgi:hypothetical protein
VLQAKLVNAPPAGQNASPSALANSLAQALTGSLTPPATAPPPASVNSLREAFANIGVYDGLELKIRGEDTRDVYRDPALLISGSAQLTFTVAGP